jgi:hypothetical protein
MSQTHTHFLVIGSNKYRQEMLERDETFTTNLQHEKEVRRSWALA